MIKTTLESSAARWIFWDGFLVKCLKQAVLLTQAQDIFTFLSMMILRWLKVVTQN